MLSRLLRAAWGTVMTPLARLLLAWRVSPDVVTVLGTLGVCAGALGFYPRGQFLVGTLVVTVFVFGDNLDGTMARLAGRQGPWGAFLDSTMDRIADAAVFGGLVLYYAGAGDHLALAALALACLALGMVVSYAKARAEGLGLTCNVGIAERADRLIAVLLATGLVGLGLTPWVLGVVLALLAVASAVTVVQRMVAVHRQTRANDPAARS